MPIPLQFNCVFRSSPHQFSSVQFNWIHSCCPMLSAVISCVCVSLFVCAYLNILYVFGGACVSVRLSFAYMASVKKFSFFLSLILLVCTHCPTNMPLLWPKYIRIKKSHTNIRLIAYFVRWSSFSYSKSSHIEQHLFSHKTTTKKNKLAL